MKIKMKKMLGIILSLVLVLGLMSGMSLTAYAETIEYDNYFVEVENLNQTCVDAGICSMTNGLNCKGLSEDVAKAACNYLKSKTDSKVAVVYGFAVNTSNSNWSKIYIMVDGSPVTNCYGNASIKYIIGDDCKLFYVKSDAPDFETVSATVTFKVLNGQWDNGTTEDVTVSLGGLKDTVYLASDQIPAVGTKPNDTYKAGSWDTTPSTYTAINESTTYTYTYVAKEASNDDTQQNPDGTKTVTKENADGKTITVTNYSKTDEQLSQFVFEKAKGTTVDLTNVNSKTLKTVVVPESVKANGNTYKVTRIRKGFLKNCKQATKVDIGKNINTIDKKAFNYGKKVQKVVIRGKLKKVGKNAFKNTKKNVVIKVKTSAKNFEKNKKLLEKSGLPKNATVKRVKNKK